MTPAVPASPPLPSPSSAALPSATPTHPLPPGYVSVLCPPGFTGSSLKEHSGARPLYARLIYRPL